MTRIDEAWFRRRHELMERLTSEEVIADRERSIEIAEDEAEARDIDIEALQGYARFAAKNILAVTPRLIAEANLEEGLPPAVLLVELMETAGASAFTTGFDFGYAAAMDQDTDVEVPEP